jgi:KaiC/GvpD/RAD55 family RecA-like ATPase
MFDVLDELQLGEHAALIYQSKTDQLACALPYIAIGLRRKERCVYIAVDNSVAEISSGLEKIGINVAEALSKGALQIVTKSESYLRHGVFEPDKMIDDFHVEVKRAIDDGYTGLRASGEMSWALDLPSAMARIIEYEEKLHARWPSLLGGLCQFDESRFPKSIIDRMISMHRIIVRGGRVVRRAINQDSHAIEMGNLVHATERA